MSTQFESFGKYVLLEKLATGGMAEVFLARGSGAGGIAKFFAVKRILPQFSDNPEFIEMFKAEAKIAINLNHSNIVSIHEFDIKNGQFFLVMDYVEGRNLRQILNKMKKSGMQFSIDQIVFMVKEIAAGLDHAHRCLDGSTGKPLNITHRDMSPQNIMVSFEGEAKIVDFGIAKAESQIENTRAGTLKGKFGYMSPEQADGQPVDLRTDIFSLGIVLWELLANDRLFTANNEINTLRKIRDCQIPSLRKINPNIHSELERIVTKTLTRDRNLRYQTCAALHRDLNRFLNRQYPDFAPQDFAIFIKSVFADEILSLRKRLVEFSKINVSNQSQQVSLPASGEHEDRTALLDTQTNSLIVSDSSSSVAAFGDVNTVTAKQTSSKILDEASLNRSTQTKKQAPPKDFKTSPGLMPAHESQEITSPSISRHSQVTRLSRTYGSYHAQPAKRSKSMTMFTTLAVICAMYIGLVRFLPVPMAPVIAQTDPVLRPLHKFLGAHGASDIASTARPPARTPSEVPPLPAPPVAAAPKTQPVVPTETTPSLPPPTEINPPAPEILNTGHLVISSMPSGAEIFIDGQNTGMVTPSRVQVSNDRPFRLSVRKRGYLEYVKKNLKKEEVGNKLNISLIKSAMGYLDIDVIPPAQVTLYLNGVKQDERPPLRNFPVEAGQDIKLRVQDANQNSSEEVTVRLQENKRRHVQLFLKKNNRKSASESAD